MGDQCEYCLEDLEGGARHSLTIDPVLTPIGATGGEHKFCSLPCVTFYLEDIETKASPI